MTEWPHSPVHRITEAGAYMVTAGTYLKGPLRRGPERLGYLCETLLEVAGKHGWQLQAWAVFPNHYHFVALSPEKTSASRNPKNLLTEFTRHLHSVTSIQANRWDQAVGRQTWFQYWDSQLTFQESYFARLSYVHRNAVHHKLVGEPSLYPWCSAGWFQRRASTSFYKRIMAMKIDRVKVNDDFSVDAGEIQRSFGVRELAPAFLVDGKRR